MTQESPTFGESHQPGDPNNPHQPDRGDDPLASMHFE